MKTKTKTSLMKRADKLFADYWKQKIGKCERCGSKNYLNLCHIITREVRKLRYDRDNTMVLCASCHTKMHDRPIEFYELIKKLKGDGKMLYLKKASNILKPLAKDFYQNVINKLTEQNFLNKIK